METMENWRKKQHMREVLLGHYFSRKSAAESYRLLVQVYREHAMSKAQCFEWHRRFKNGYFEIRDKERPGQPKKFEDDELKALIEEDPCRTQEELAVLLKVTQKQISVRLKAMGMVRKQGKWGENDLII